MSEETKKGIVAIEIDGGEYEQARIILVDAAGDGKRQIITVVSLDHAITAKVRSGRGELLAFVEAGVLSDAEGDDLRAHMIARTRQRARGGQ